ncbi:MAG: carbohydrate ABC transporter permease [Acutalibacteraceae bacterium]
MENTKKKKVSLAERIRFMKENKGPGHLSDIKLRNRSAGGYITTIIVLLLMSVVMVIPMVYIICNAIKPLNELWVFPPRFFPHNPTLKNFKDLVEVMSTSTVPFSRYIFNTIFIAVVGTGCHVILSSLCAYVFSRRRMVGKEGLFKAVQTALMFVGGVTTIPSFLIMVKLGWIDTYWAYIVPAIGAPMGLYLMKQFMEQMVPMSVIEAARIDGCGEFRILFQIVMPIVKSAWVTLIILSFQGLWNTGGSNYIYDESLKTFNYALQQIISVGVIRAGIGAAGQVLLMLVPITVFLISQSNVMETMATSGMKE